MEVLLLNFGCTGTSYSGAQCGERCTLYMLQGNSFNYIYPSSLFFKHREVATYLSGIKWGWLRYFVLQIIARGHL